MSLRLKWNERVHAYGYESRDAALAASPEGARVVPYVLAGNRQRSGAGLPMGELTMNPEYQKVRDLLPSSATVGTWYPLKNGFAGCINSRGTITIRRAVRLLPGGPLDHYRLDRVTPRGRLRFAGYSRIN